LLYRHGIEGDSQVRWQCFLIFFMWFKLKQCNFYYSLENSWIHCVFIRGSLILYLQNTGFMTQACELALRLLFWYNLQNM
jgi:RimJ/RimL family protein N-acetyltransferase